MGPVRSDWERVALKVIRKSAEVLQPPGLFWEVNSMKALDHENILKLLEVIDTEETFFLEMEGLSEGDMCSHLEDHGT